MEYNKEDYKKGQEMLKEAAKKLKGLTDSITSNPMLAQAKVDHKDKMKGILVGILAKAIEDKTSLDTDEDRDKVAQEFVDAYDEQVLSPLGM